MKVVLFCGGLGLRLREHDDTLPKPMVPIGGRPIIWHLMRYYAHFGHREFVLCLGYRADLVKRYFLRYSEALTNDFVLSGGGREIELLGRDIADWRIAFADTGLNANLGTRLLAVRGLLGDDEVFLANYGDVLSDVPTDELVADFLARDKVAALVTVQPTAYSFHVVRARRDHRVIAIEDVRAADLWINGGFFIFRRDIFDYIRPGEELVEEPFHRLIAADQLVAYPHTGFWAPMDTIKDVRLLEAQHETGRPPWAVWLPDEGT